MMWLRRRRVDKLNQQVPPITWEEFRTKYLERGLVKSVVYHPHFKVADVVLHEVDTKKRNPFVAQSSEDLPDVRFSYEGRAEELETELVSHRHAANDQRSCTFESRSFFSTGDIGVVAAAGVGSLLLGALITAFRYDR